MAFSNAIWTCVLYGLIFPLLTFAVVIVLKDIKTWYHLPRGPLPLPFIGNLLTLKREKLHLQLEQWSKVYGPIFTIYIARRPALIISSPIIANALMTNRSSKYSSRPRAVVLGEIYSQMSSLVVLPYGPALTLRRKLLHHSLSLTAVSKHKERQEAEASKLAFHFLQSPADFDASIGRFAASLVFSLSYGRRIDTLSSEIVQKRLTFIQYMAKLMVPGAYLTNAMPVLAHIPDFFAPWRKEIREMGNREKEFNISLMDVVRDDLAKAGGTGPGSLSETLLNIRKKDPAQLRTLSDRDLASIPSTMFGAGVETTVSAIRTAIFALITHPNVMAELHEDIDNIVGRARSPTFQDVTALPYLEAVVQEVLRWRSPVTMSLPHATSEDDVYECWQIPKETTVISNTWAINHNPEFFPSSQTFAPERYLPATNQRYNPSLVGEAFQGKWRHSTFGWGRRACSGADLAMNSLRIVIAKMVWAFEIKGVEDQVYDMNNGYEWGTISRPKPFPVQFLVRSDAHLVVLEKEMTGANAVLEALPPFE